MSIKNSLEKFTKEINPITGLIIAIAAISTASVLIRFAQRGYSSLFIAAGRLSIASLVLLPFFLGHDKSAIKSLAKLDLLYLTGAGLFLALHFASWIRSLALTNVVSSVVLVTTTPIWVSLFSFFIFKEQLNRLFYIGLIVAFMGVTAIAFSELCAFSQSGFSCQMPMSEELKGTSLQGNLLAILGAVCAAGYILCGKMVRDKLDNLSYVFIIYSIASIILIMAVIFKDQAHQEVSNPQFGWIILIALIPQLIGHSMINWSLGHLPASYVSLSLLGEPAGSTLLALVLLREYPTILQVIGSAVILLGLMVATNPAGTKAT
jgi:drug/metabolite transporter (DMT)-like permease